MTAAGASARWDGDTQRLDRVLAELQLARSRSRAAELIGDGAVFLDGTPVTKPGARVHPGTTVSVGERDRYVSRGAFKLLAGLDCFRVDPRGRVALDVGASTGGFTQVLLERGARIVLAVDVGHAQMAAELRADARVRLVEGCNARALTPERLAEDTGVAEAPRLIVADLSFISLTLVLGALSAVVADDGHLVLLIKPQFEVGPGSVKDGIVTEPEQRAEAIRSVLASAARAGLAVQGLTPSPIAGGNGNAEYLVHFTPGEPANPAEWESRIRAMTTDHDAARGGA